MARKTKNPAIAALEKAGDMADWTQVALNHAYGSPCFQFETERERFCLRAASWHGEGTHDFVSLGTLIRRLAAH